MIIKKLDYQTDKTIVMNPETGKVLFQFKDGEYESEDKNILAVWNKHYLKKEIELEPEEKPKRRGRPKKND